MNWHMDRSESVSEFKVTNCDLENKAADAQHKPPYEAQLGRGQAVPTQNQTELWLKVVYGELKVAYS
jgi:hypothetical protein